MVAAEDMRTSLGLHDSKSNDMLNFVRKRFHIACKAYNKFSIDMPYTWNNKKELIQEVKYTKSLGIQKEPVFSSHCSTINKILTPSLKEIIMQKKLLKNLKKF